jgi:DNA-directed RNA polymerase subunit RPC12/RpoP
VLSNKENMAMTSCHACSKDIPDNAVHCPECGAPQIVKPRAQTKPSGPNPVLEPIPDGVKGWCWGGFLMNVFWAIRFRVWLGLLALIPIIGIGACFWLGFKGRELAWQKGNWSSVEAFNQSQRRWSIAGAVFLVAGIAINVLLGFAKETYKTPAKEEIVTGIELAVPPIMPEIPAPAEHPHDESTLANVDKEGIDLLETRYGPLTTNQHAQLILNGQLVKPAIQANSSLSIKESFRIGDDYVVLIENIGGTACPALFNFVTARANGAQSYPTFGTCSDTYQIERSGDSVVVTMQGEGNQAHRYVFTKGSLTDNGQPAESQPVKNFSVEAVIDDPDGYTNVRAQANGQSAIIGRVESGATFQTHPQHSEWWTVKIGGNRTGFIHRSRIVLLQQRF